MWTLQQFMCRKSRLFLFSLMAFSILISGCLSSNTTQSIPEKFSPKTAAFDSFPDFLKTNMQQDYVSFINKASTSQEKTQAKIAVLGQMYRTLIDKEGIKGLCEKGLNSNLDSQIHSRIDRGSACDVECGIVEMIKANRDAIKFYNDNLDACSSGVDYPDKNMVKAELENYFSYIEKVLQYIESM